MDANGQKFWMLAEENHFDYSGEAAQVSYDRNKRCLKLARQRNQMSFVGEQAAAQAFIEQIPSCMDGYDNLAWWDAEQNRVMAHGAFAGAVEIYSPPLLAEDEAEFSNEPTDLVMGFDGVFYIAINDRVIMKDRRQRWDDVQLRREAFSPWRMAASSNGGVWLLDRDSGRLGRLIGQPPAKRLARPGTPERATVCDSHDDPPRILELSASFFGDDETPVAIAASHDDQLAVMSWLGDGTGLIRFIRQQNDGSLAVSEAYPLSGVSFPCSLSWHGNGLLAVLVAGDYREIPVYAVANAGENWWPVGDLYPLADNFIQAPFVHTLSAHAHYPVLAANAEVQAKTVRKLSFPFYSKKGFAWNNNNLQLLDSEQQDTTWHRLYLEARIPQACGIRVFLSASESWQRPLQIPHEHRFGDSYTDDPNYSGPQACWEPFASEIPHSEGFIPCDIERNRCGLFSVLIQRSGKKSRALRGRYLHLHIELNGTGRSSPEIYAVRAYGSRFSYVNEYLPPLYHETITEPEANQDGAATRADFLDRFVANFEGVLTRLEGQVGEAHRLSLPETAASQSLPWLANWTGTCLDQAMATEDQRKVLRASHFLNRWRGTLGGVAAALELASGGDFQQGRFSGGAVSSGQIVLLEDYRLRRTFATIIGAKLDDDKDPLTLAGRVSGNSFVGDTLFIGDENRKEFLALFSADLAVSESEQQAIDDLFDRLANRLTLLVHADMPEQQRDLIRQVAEREVPAHVQFRILSASPRFLVGMASLVGVDTWLGQKPGPKVARVGQSHLSRNSYITGPAALDPRLEGMGSGLPRGIEQPPEAVISDVTVAHGEAIVLDASASRAWQGRRITEYHWSINEE
ncbi:phage tail protein domain-containing protein [Alteromonadaceae bacterium Bs31]|nr:phage tail protein domain-containing protein [Alteromonadaceae bacterium Bs31]